MKSVILRAADPQGANIRVMIGKTSHKDLQKTLPSLKKLPWAATDSKSAPSSSEAPPSYQGQLGQQSERRYQVMPKADLMGNQNDLGRIVVKGRLFATSSRKRRGPVLSAVSEDKKGDTLRCCPAVSGSSLVQTSKSERPWRLASMSLNDTQPDVLQSLNSVLSSELGFGLLYAPGSETTLSNLIPGILNTFGSDQDLGSELEYANETRKGITKVIEAVSGTLGLENSAIAWWCVTKLLKVCTTVLKPPTPHSQQYLTNYRYTKPASTHLLPSPPTKSNQSTSPPS